MKITNKYQMYNLLRAGHFGNTVLQYFNVYEWRVLAPPQIELWGIRSLKPNDPRSFMNVKRSDVPFMIALHFGRTDDDYNISPMVDQYAALRCQVQELPGYGFHLEYVDPEADLTGAVHPWREGFRDHRRDAYNTLAWELLRYFNMTQVDTDNLKRLLDLYPDHVIEFTVCGRELGVVPGCRTVIWEVRAY